MADSAAPTGERGQIAHGGVIPWAAFYVDQVEYVPELQWPMSVPVYDRMLTDAQLSGLQRSVRLPLQARNYVIDPNGADEESVVRLADDLDLPILGQDRGPRRRRRNRFSFADHIPTAMRALGHGHYFFEQVGEIGDDGLWHLRKLAPRPPRTISEINVEADGGLKSIKQNIGFNPPELPVSRLVAYVWDYEAGMWAGTSMIRPCYKNWLIKDRLLRVDAIKHERSGMGIPVAEAAPGMGPEEVAQLGEMMRAMKVTETGGGAVPSGVKAMLMGTTGSLPDTIDSIRFHNEEMNNSFLAMFKNLGQSQAGGSYALGQVQYDFFGLALDAVEDWLLTTFNLHVVEDWYDWNYGEDSQPALVVVDEDDEPDSTLFQQGLEEADEEGEREVEQFEAAAKEKLAREKRVRGRRRSGGAASVESPSLPLPDRPLRRQPYAHEITAATDFAEIDQKLDDGIAKLTDEIKKLQKVQVSELRDLIVDADGDLAKLAVLEPTPVAESAILNQMQLAASSGIDEAAKEAQRQGKAKVTKPSLDDDLQARLAARAAATDRLLARDFGTAASRQAMRLTNEGVAATKVADQVAAHLTGLSTKYIEDKANGALTQAMNDGRKATMTRNSPKRIYSSELLDSNTCEECVAVDGREYEAIDDANEDYPTGGYSDCLGMERCRGTLVAVYHEGESESPTTVQTPDKEYTYPGAPAT
jgi:hypothetical protein